MVRLSRLLVIPFFLVIAGCGGAPEDKRVNISGQATFGGKAIVFGSVDLVPDDTKGHTGPAGMAVIIDGKYDTAAPGGTGIFPGPHIVRITGYDSRPMERKSELDPAPAANPLFVGYMVRMDLKSSPVDLDVPTTAKGQDFSKPAAANQRRSNDP